MKINVRENNNVITILENTNYIYDVMNDHYDEDYIDDLLDEIGTVQIGSLIYSASLVLKRVDPIAYKCSIDDILDADASDVIYNLDRYDEAEWNGYTFTIED